MTGTRLLEAIGCGSTSVVHRAVDAWGRVVAVKTLRPETAGDPGARHRLAREMAVLARVSNPHVVGLLGGDPGADPPYAVLGYVPGVTLREGVRARGPLRGAAAADLARDLAGGLAAVHAAGVLHRDVAPANVMVAGGAPVLIDFGLAHDTAEPQVTSPGLLRGTPAYLAPELIEGGPATAASDVFAWGATVAFAATGRPPFGGGSLHAVCFRILRGAVDLEGVQEPLASLLRLALHRDPAARPPAAWLATFRTHPRTPRWGRPRTPGRIAA